MGEIPLSVKKIILTANLFTFGCSVADTTLVPPVDVFLPPTPEPAWAASPVEHMRDTHLLVAESDEFIPNPIKGETLPPNPSIVILGDSITYLTFGKAFKEKALTVGLSNVVASGHEGYGTGMILEAFHAPKPKDRIHIGYPDVLIVELGTNDVWRSSRTPKEIADNIAKIIDYVRQKNPNVHVIVMPVYPMDINDDGILDVQVRRLAVNREYAQIATEQSTWSSPVVFIDAEPYEYFDTVDGVHPASQEAEEMVYMPLEIIVGWLPKEVSAAAE
jgi:lysophospholipase L1-like esterase